MEIFIILILLMFFVTKFLFFNWWFTHCFYTNRKRKGLKIRFFNWLNANNSHQLYIASKVSFLILISNIIIVVTGIFLKKHIILYTIILVVLLVPCIIMLSEKFADYVEKCLVEEEKNN